MSEPIAERATPRWYAYILYRLRAWACRQLEDAGEPPPLRDDGSPILSSDPPAWAKKKCPGAK